MTISAQFFVSTVVGLTLIHFWLLAISYLILLERKIASWAQDRIGPNRVGLTFGFLSNDLHMFGLGQPLADGIKFLVKEDYNPTNVDKWLFYIAPALGVIPALVAWVVIPWGGVFDFAGFSFTLPLIGQVVVEGGRTVATVADLNIGVIYILALGSLAVYGVVVGAWASNNKFAFFGGLRGTAQMLSYEIPMGICVLVVLLMAGSARALNINDAQVETVWFIVQQPLAAILFFTCVLAECNRAPFDLPEAESELVGGYHTEYSSMKFALFFLGEYMHMITGAAFFALLFLGGWHMPFMGSVFEFLGIADDGLLAVLIKTGNFVIKVVVLLAIMMWIRWTLPRFRFDQLMRLAWRAMIPLSLALLLMTGIFVHLGLQNWFWLGNLVLIVAAMAIAPLVPEGKPVNRRIGLEGSRFSPAEV
jgi:NADH-quinone oxidoreductase subunit H